MIYRVDTIMPLTFTQHKDNQFCISRVQDHFIRESSTFPPKKMYLLCTFIQPFWCTFLRLYMPKTLKIVESSRLKNFFIIRQICFVQVVPTLISNTSNINMQAHITVFQYQSETIFNYFLLISLTDACMLQIFHFCHSVQRLQV